MNRHTRFASVGIAASVALCGLTMLLATFARSGTDASDSSARSNVPSQIAATARQGSTAAPRPDTLRLPHAGQGEFFYQARSKHGRAHAAWCVRGRVFVQGQSDGSHLIFAPDTAHIAGRIHHLGHLRVAFGRTLTDGSSSTAAPHSTLGTGARTSDEERGVWRSVAGALRFPKGLDAQTTVEDEDVFTRSMDWSMKSLSPLAASAAPVARSKTTSSPSAVSPDGDEGTWRLEGVARRYLPRDSTLGTSGVIVEQGDARRTLYLTDGGVLKRMQWTETLTFRDGGLQAARVTSTLDISFDDPLPRSVGLAGAACGTEVPAADTRADMPVAALEDAFEAFTGKLMLTTSRAPLSDFAAQAMEAMQFLRLRPERAVDWVSAVRTLPLGSGARIVAAAVLTATAEARVDGALAALMSDLSFVDSDAEAVSLAQLAALAQLTFPAEKTLEILLEESREPLPPRARRSLWLAIGNTIGTSREACARSTQGSDGAPLCAGGWMERAEVALGRQAQERDRTSFERETLAIALKNARARPH